MNKLRIEEIKQMSPAELEQTLEDKYEEFHNLKFQHATHQLDNPLQLRLIRKAIARIKTTIKENEQKENDIDKRSYLDVRLFLFLPEKFHYSISSSSSLAWLIMGDAWTPWSSSFFQPRHRLNW